jgi:acetylglutamate kinase
MTRNVYYCQFQGATFVIQAESEAVEDRDTTGAILDGIGDLLRHGIRVVLVFGKGDRFENELRTTHGARPHPETNRLVIPESSLARIREERSRVGQAVASLCRSADLPCSVLPESMVRAERRIGHGSTGVVATIDTPAIRGVLDEGKLAILGFGGEDHRGHFLQVPSTSIAADLAVELPAEKLLLLTQAGGIVVPDRKGDPRQLSFADLEELLCLLQRKDAGGHSILRGEMLPKVHAAIRAAAGGVSQVHLVSYSRLLDEILTRTGVGTMIERRQSHHVDFARPDDLDEIVRLHVESRRYVTRWGTPFVKPLGRSELERLVPHTLLLKHRRIIVGKLHATEVPGAPGAIQIGGVVIGENHQDSQQGQLLLGEALQRFAERGHTVAVAVTASERAKKLFERLGGRRESSGPWQTRLLDASALRYAPEERSDVQLFEFPLKP